jgi:poly(A) polymerase
MRRVKKKHGYSEDMVENGTCKLLPYGSFKMGVSSVSGDIDSLVIAPHYVDRHEDFFGCLYPLLKEKAEKDKTIQDLNAVDQENTIMPLIKMTFYDV